MGRNRNIILIIVAVGLIIFSYFLFFKKADWQGVYYPDGCLVCEDDYVFSPVFKTKEECIDWGEDKSNNKAKGLYECGKNCEWKNEFMICEKTVDE